MPARTARFQSRIPVPRAYVWDHYTRPGMFERLAPPWQHIQTVAIEGDVRPGDRLVLRPRVGPLRVTWEAIHGEYDAGRLFSDRQGRGPFASWEHRHHFLDAGADGCIVRDEVSFALPLAPLAHPLAMPLVARELRRMFYYRHFTAYHDLLEHHSLRAQPRRRIVVRGGPGEIRDQIAAYLSVGGHDVSQSVERGPAGAVDIEIGGRAATGLTVELRGARGGSGVRRVTSAMLLDGSAATRVRVARLLLERPDRELRWTTLADFAAAVHRAVLGAGEEERLHVAHPNTVTPRELSRCSGLPMALMPRLPSGDAEVEPVLVEMRGPVVTRSRYRSAAHALRVMDGRA